MSGAPRKQFGDQLRADWADIPALESVAVIVAERELGDVPVLTALVRQKSVSKTPELPLSHRNYGLLLTLISPLGDTDSAADQLDVAVDAVLDYLDTRYAHGDAECVGYNDRLAYDIPVTALAAKD